MRTKGQALAAISAGAGSRAQTAPEDARAAAKRRVRSKARAVAALGAPSSGQRSRTAEPRHGTERLRGVKQRAGAKSRAVAAILPL